MKAHPRNAILALILTACVPAAIPPAVGLVACVGAEERQQEQAPVPLVDFVGKCIVDCGADAFAILDALLASNEPQIKASAHYAEAAAIRVDAEAMARFKALAEKRAGAYRAEKAAAK